MSIAAVLPLALVMVAGPQIISAFFFATSEEWQSDSAAYILGAATSINRRRVGFLPAHQGPQGRRLRRWLVVFLGRQRHRRPSHPRDGRLW
ncbi:MAG TPA: hypothetical protein VHM66_10000 [Solirubrobacterales bacterium]|nr:hypothetical protein [Solirubrobacterales bacterium]